MSWLLANRFGLARIAGRALLPSQSKPAATELKINHKHNFLEAPFGIKAILFYPQKIRHDFVILLHNPNGATIEDCIHPETGKLIHMPRYLMDLFGVAVIMYDYRGTGLSKDVVSEVTTSSFSIPFRPTYATLTEDAYAMTRCVGIAYNKIMIWGVSLGGALGTIALHEFLQGSKERASRFLLVNHDSFLTSGRVMLPSMPRFADFMGWLVGGQLDAETAMSALVDTYKVDVMIMVHDKDPLIKKGAQMKELFEGKKKMLENVEVISSSMTSHGGLTEDMIFELSYSPLLFSFKNRAVA